ncbi:hypothetical protein ACRPMQ_09820 [Lactiplantibacillus argentoratensis]|uniref:hypothetical protein n=1 Tax=Lactiplantibacillus argentoratensis TaxID=271881 RepID=UPI003D77D4BD
MIKVYLKQPFQAEQFDGSNEMREKYHIAIGSGWVAPYRINTLEGWVGVQINSWIATGVNGEHWTITDDVFKKSYAELPVLSKKLDSYIQLYKRENYGITAMLYDLTGEVCPDVHLTKDDIARAWLDGYVVEEEK